MNQYDRNNRSSNNSNDSVSDSGTLGKRQRFFNLVRNTKDVYIPSLTSTISQKTSDGFRKVSAERNEPFINMPTDMDIIFYPTYSTKVGDEYETTIRFAVCAPGNLASRKNRILFSLCKQLVKPILPEDFDGDVMQAKLDDALGANEVHSTMSSRSTSASLSTREQSSGSMIKNPAPNELDILKERTIGFFTRNVPNMPIIIDFISKKGSAADYETITRTTDERGNLFCKVRTNFLPNTIRITLDTPIDFPKVISHEYSCSYVKPEGFGVISDIDDTIKHTGVTGDKRSMFRNVFINDIETWLIQDVSHWYSTLREEFDLDFFYVSNSPIQIYPLLQQYITKNFPWGPLFLKQYSGNLLSSIMTSSANRKLVAIGQVLRDFPEKKFILVGDSGEQDFEAYITTAVEHPDQIIAIYIRCCKNSMSDMGLREIEVMRELNDMISDEYLSPSDKQSDGSDRVEDIVRQEPNLHRPPPPPPPVPLKKPKLTAEQEKMIKDSRPPPIPARKPRLSAEQEATIKKSHRYVQEDVETPPKLPPRSSVNEEVDPMVYYTPSTQNDYGAYSSFFDKKADNWRNRVINSLAKLNQIKRDHPLRLMFFMKPEVPLKDCMKELQQK